MINVLLQLLPKMDGSAMHPLIQLLPSFLASIQASSYFNAIISHQITSDDDKRATEAILMLTDSAPSSITAASIFKCLKCLATGLISRQIAEPWLRTFCKPAAIAKIWEISDFIFLHPSRFPHELILCPEFRDESEVMTITERFLDWESTNRSFSSFRPISRDLLVLRLHGIRQLIRKTRDGGKITSDELSLLYGSQGYAMAKFVPFYPFLAIERLSEAYLEARELLRGMYEVQMGRVEASDCEYRIRFKDLNRRDFMCFHYGLPGERMIGFGNRRCFMVGVAIIQRFARLFFNEKAQNTIKTGICRILETCDVKRSEETFIVNDRIVSALVYLSKLCEMVMECGNVDEVGLGDDGELSDTQESEFGRKIVEMCGEMRRINALCEIFGNCRMQHVDLVIIRCVRQLYVVGEKEDVVQVFPNGIEGDLIVISVKQIEDEGLFGLMCVSFVSPCAVEYSGDVSDSTEEAE
jgi:hypothetical protein